MQVKSDEVITFNLGDVCMGCSCEKLQFPKSVKRYEVIFKIID